MGGSRAWQGLAGWDVYEWLVRLMVAMASEFMMANSGYLIVVDDDKMTRMTRDGRSS